MTDPLHTRLIGYLKKLDPREDLKEVVQDVGLTMAKDIDRLADRVVTLEKKVTHLQGEQDA